MTFRLTKKRAYATVNAMFALGETATYPGRSEAELFAHRACRLLEKLGEVKEVMGIIGPSKSDSVSFWARTSTSSIFPCQELRLTISPAMETAPTESPDSAPTA